MRQQAEQQDDVPSLTSPPPHPLVHSTPSPSVLADKARTDWRRHGTGVSQEIEDKRQQQNENGIVVRVISAENRVDASGAIYTSYVTSVLSSHSQFTIEHRYGEFAKLHALLRKYGVVVSTAFPAKHWAGRMGHWTPSRAWAPSAHDDLVAYRKIQLDLWLVDVVHIYNQNGMQGEPKTAIYEFLHNAHRAPCQDENIDESSTLSQTLQWSNPLSFTLGTSIRQATRTVQHMMSAQTTDQSIPLDLLHHAQGLCFLTVAKCGLVISGKVGTGLLIAKNEGGWSAPSALGTVGVGWGAQVGGDITHYLVVLTTTQALQTLCGDSSLNLGAELGVAVGPVGRGAHISSSTPLQPAYAYAHSQGLFVGMSLEGSVVATRHDVNAKFYGSQVKPEELLLNSTVAPPRAAEPLYQALKEALEAKIPEDGFRPSQLWKTSSEETRNTTLKEYIERPQTIDTMNTGHSSLFDMSP
jgi:lipid-binding SYLF domain-containing protein